MPRLRSVHLGRLDLRRCRSRCTGIPLGSDEWVRRDHLGSPRPIRTEYPATMTGEPVTNIDFFLAERDLLTLYVQRFPSDRINQAACRGVDPERYHPDRGSPATADIQRCHSCPIRLECVALALRNEYPEVRSGWYGGLAPEDRAVLVESIDLPVVQGDEPGGVARRIIELREHGWQLDEIALELGCSRRTVQRHLARAA